MIRRSILLPALLSATAVVPALGQGTERSLGEACPKLSAEEIARIESYKGEFAENALYARAYCVPIEEAERRMEIQNRGAIGPKTEPGRPPPPPDDSIGALNGALQQKEAGTFAGLWIQHQPDYRVVVAFTRDAAATLAKYTKETLFKPLDRPGPTLVELRAMQDRLIREFNARGFRWSGAGASEKTGTVEITLGQDASPIRAAAARGEFPLPPWVVLIEPRPLPVPAPPPPRAGDTRVRSFPQLPFRTDMDIRTLVGVPDIPATLRLVDGCLKIDTGSEVQTALWQASDALDVSDPAKVTVVDRLSGIRIAAGQEIVLMGLQPGEGRVPEQLLGAEGCPGPYRVVRGFQPRVDWENQQREGRLSRRFHELGSREAAIADYEADQARLPALRAWREQMLSDQGDAVGAIWIDEDNGTAHLFHTSARRPDQLVPASLRSFVTAQEVPVGHRVLAEAEASLRRQLAEAGIAAQVQGDALQGIVSVRPADPRLLSQAATAGKIAFPEVARLEMEGAAPLSDDRERMGRDPEAIWLRLEAASDFGEIRKLVEATELPLMEPPPPPRREGSPATPPSPPRARFARPSRAASLQTSHFLVAYGQTAKEIAALKARGFDPVDALDATNGRATAVTTALLARQVVVAELVALNMRDRGRDGYRSTARWRVVETLKGSARPGDALQVRMLSGEEPDGRIVQSNEEPLVLPGLPGALEPGGRWLLHLNDALYAHAAFIHGGKDAARRGEPFYVQTITPAPVVGDEIKARFFAQTPSRLSGLRRSLAPLQKAMIDSGLVARAER